MPYMLCYSKNMESVDGGRNPRMSGGVGSPEAQTEALLIEWMILARHNKRVHLAASTYYRKLADTSKIMSIITGTTSSILNIVLGELDPVNYVVVNLSQNLLGLTGLGATVNMTISKQLDLDALGFLHAEYSSMYCEAPPHWSGGRAQALMTALGGHRFETAWNPLRGRAILFARP